MNRIGKSIREGLAIALVFLTFFSFYLVCNVNMR